MEKGEDPGHRFVAAVARRDERLDRRPGEVDFAPCRGAAPVEAAVFVDRAQQPGRRFAHRRFGGRLLHRGEREDAEDGVVHLGDAAGNVGEAAAGQLPFEDLGDEVVAGEVVRVAAGGVDDEEFALERRRRDLRPGDFFAQAGGEVGFQVRLRGGPAGGAGGGAGLVERIDAGRRQRQRDPGADALRGRLAGVGVGAAFELVGLEEGDDRVDRLPPRGDVGAGGRRARGADDERDQDREHRRRREESPSLSRAGHGAPRPCRGRNWWRGRRCRPR